MVLRRSRRPFNRRVRTERTGSRSSGRLKIRSRRSERTLRASKSVSLAVTVCLMGMLVYALFKFFEMVRLRGLELWPLAFVPAAMVAVLLVLLRVARGLVKEIRAQSSSE